MLRFAAGVTGISMGVRAGNADSRYRELFNRVLMISAFCPLTCAVSCLSKNSNYHSISGNNDRQ